jgi:hypothetical protein
MEGAMETEWTLTDLDHEINNLFRAKDALAARGLDKEQGGEYDRLLYRLRDLTRLRMGIVTD